MRPATLRARALDFFLEPAAGRPPSPSRVAPWRARAATRMPLRAAVLGSVDEAVPVGALLANAMRSAAGAPAAGLAVWAPGASDVVRAGPASFGSARVAARLAARGLPAVGRGRLAWMALDEHPVAAAVAARRAAGALEVPLVVVLAGARCEVVEGVLAEQDLVVVAAGEPDGALARLAVASCTVAALACPPPGAGPARWLARTGASGRGLSAPLRALVAELAAPSRDAKATEVAW